MSGNMPRPSFTLALVTGTALAAGLVLWVPGIRVVDGDTVDHGFWRYRLAGFDAPEIGKAKCASERALGERAAQRLREMVAEGVVDLTRKGRTLDPYHRRLAVLKVDSADVGERLIAEGLARPYGSGRRGWCE